MIVFTCFSCFSCFIIEGLATGFGGDEERDEESSTAICETGDLASESETDILRKEAMTAAGNVASSGIEELASTGRAVMVKGDAALFIIIFKALPAE